VSTVPVILIALALYLSILLFSSVTNLHLRYRIPTSTAELPICLHLLSTTGGDQRFAPDSQTLSHLVAVNPDCAMFSASSTPI
jgi:hypothetical protein